MPTDALLTLGMLKLTSLMMESFRTIAVRGGGCARQSVFQLASNGGIILFLGKQMQLAQTIEMRARMAACWGCRS
jgi:hypothetical protein